MSQPASDEFPPLHFDEVPTDEKPTAVLHNSPQQKHPTQEHPPAPHVHPIALHTRVTEVSDIPQVTDLPEPLHERHIHIQVDSEHQSQPDLTRTHFEKTEYHEQRIEIELPVQNNDDPDVQPSPDHPADVSDDDAALAVPRALEPNVDSQPVKEEVHGDGDDDDNGDADGDGDGDADADGDEDYEGGQGHIGDDNIEYKALGGAEEDEQDIMLVLPEKRNGKRNAPRRRAPPRRLSFATPDSPRSKKAKRCKRVECANFNSRNWCTGPDGPATLCYNCYMRYRDRRLVVYMDERTGRLSIAQDEGMVPMRVIGFEPREKDSYNDLNRPKVVRLGDSEQDMRLLRNSKVNGKQRSGKRRRAEEDGIVKQGEKPFARMGSGGARPLAEGLAEGEGIYVKAEWRSDMRRFRIPHDVSLYAFREEIRRVFQWRKEQLFCVTFMDQRGDFVRLGEESKMKEMFQMIEKFNMFPLRIRIVT